MENSSARNLWGDYLDKNVKYAFAQEPRVIPFSDIPEEADQLLKAVLDGDKRAVTHSLLGLQMRKEPLPKIGDFTVLLDGKGEAQAIIRTVAVRLRPFFSVPESYAQLSGLPDLHTWKDLHWGYFERELAAYQRKPLQSMIVVCEVFEKVYPV